MKENLKFFIALAIIIILIQIFNILGNVNYDWKFIIIEFLLIIVISFIIGFVYYIKYKNIIINFNNKNYDYVIKTKNILHSEKSEQKHNFYLMKAISYLEKKDYENFIFYIDKVEHPKKLLQKYFFKAIYYILINDDLNFNECRKKYDECSYLDSNLKEIYDRVFCLIDKKEPYTEEEINFINSMNFKEVKRIFKI